jgi:hypothetical protein
MNFVLDILFASTRDAIAAFFAAVLQIPITIVTELLLEWFVPPA